MHFLLRLVATCSPEPPAEASTMRIQAASASASSARLLCAQAFRTECSLHACCSGDHFAASMNRGCMHILPWSVERLRPGTVCCTNHHFISFHFDLTKYLIEPMARLLLHNIRTPKAKTKQKEEETRPAFFQARTAGKRKNRGTKGVFSNGSTTPVYLQEC